MTGANWAAATRPSTNGSLVSSSTSQPCATDCIHVPMTETSWPAPEQPVVAVAEGVPGSESRDRAEAAHRPHPAPNSSSCRTDATALGVRPGSRGNAAGAHRSRDPRMRRTTMDDDRWTTRCGAIPASPTTASQTPTAPADQRQAEVNDAPHDDPGAPEDRIGVGKPGSASPTWRRGVEPGHRPAAKSQIVRAGDSKRTFCARPASFMTLSTTPG